MFDYVVSALEILNHSIAGNDLVESIPSRPRIGYLDVAYKPGELIILYKDKTGPQFDKDAMKRINFP